MDPWCAGDIFASLPDSRAIFVAVPIDLSTAKSIVEKPKLDESTSFRAEPSVTEDNVLGMAVRLVRVFTSSLV